MEYSIKHLARMYCEYLSNTDFDVNLDVSQPCNLSTYNEYEYLKLIKQYDQLYQHTDSLNITEQFLKGELPCQITK